MGERILIVEDDPGIAGMLRGFFEEQGYQIEVVTQGEEALNWCRQQLPDLVLLDTTLPDMDGYAVCRELRATIRTSLVPVILLIEGVDLSDRVAGLEAGADDCVAKPFDIEELKLRVKAAMRAHQHFSMTDPTTHMPSGRLVEEQLRNLVRTPDWSLLYIGVDHLTPFINEYGFVAGDEALRFAAGVIQDVATEQGTLDDFVGRATNEVFVVITKSKDVSAVTDQLRRRFREGIQSHYGAADREQGGIKQRDGSLAPLIRLSIGVVSDEAGPFYDILEITRAAAEARRIDQRGQT
jgi:PleD family two-component response regulator